MTGAGARSDPFGPAIDGEVYVPRPATERALEALQVALAIGRRAVALTGPPGIGKSTLLRVLPERLERGFKSVELRGSARSPNELFSHVLALLGEPAGSDPQKELRSDPQGELLAAARRVEANGATIVVTIDDAGALPASTAEHLASLLAAAGGALRLVLAHDDDSSSRRTLAALAAEIEEVRLDRPMSEEETAAYARGRLEAAGAPSASPDSRAPFDGAALAELHRASGGIPGAVNALAGALLARRKAARAASAPDRPTDLEADGAPGTPRSPPELDTAQPAEPLGEDLQEPGRDAFADVPLDREPALDVDEWPHGEFVEEDPVDVETELRQVFRRRPRFLPEAPPDVAVVFAIVLVASLIAVGLPWLRGWIGPRGEPHPRAPVSQAQDPAHAARPTPSSAGSPGASERPLATASGEAPSAPGLPPSERLPAGTIDVSINATPWASVEIDGVYIGITPLSGVPLLPGSHLIRARMPDGTVQERVVEIDANHRHIAFGP